MRPAALLLFAAGLAAGRLVAQEAANTSRPKPPQLTVVLPRDSTGARLAPQVAARDLLADGVLLGALHNGFAVRFAYRLGLWRSATLFDRLIGEVTWEAVAVQNPVDNTYELLQPERPVQTFTDSTRLEAALAVPYRVPLLPPADSRDRFYYVANLEIASLTATELEDVERWLRGDVGGAITGRRDVGGVLTRGARMLLIRLSGLPHRSLEARTGTFRP